MRLFNIIFILLFLSAYAYAEGSDIQKDLELAKIGNSGGQFRTGARYLNGEDGVPVDYNEALKWLTLAAEQEHANALFNLGYMNLYGVGVPVDFIKAAGYFDKSKDAGFLPAYHILGVMYEDGAGVAVDRERALKYYKIAADGGYMPAKRMLDNRTGNAPK